MGKTKKNKGKKALKSSLNDTSDDSSLHEESKSEEIANLCLIAAIDKDLCLATQNTSTILVGKEHQCGSSKIFIKGEDEVYDVVKSSFNYDKLCDFYMELCECFEKSCHKGKVLKKEFDTVSLKSEGLKEEKNAFLKSCD